MKTFVCSVSRMAKGKAGYQKDKYAFGWSFYPEQHTLESLIRLAAIDGFSFLAGEFDRKPPAFYGRKDVSTPRISENFRQTVIIPLDDDGQAGNAVTFWESDLFFKTYGAGYYHSTSSTPERPRIRPIFELDWPITDGRLYQETRRAFIWYYNRNGQKRIDEIVQIPQCWYGAARPTAYKILGNVLPLEAVHEFLLEPYRQVQAARQAERQKATQRRQQQASDDIGRILDWLAGRREGDNRNLCLLWAAGALKAKGESWPTIGPAVVKACQDNGYFDSYAAGNEREISRIFDKGHYNASH